MNCDEFMDKLVDSAGEDLSLGMRLKISLHLLICPHCAARAARFEAARELLGAASFPPVPPALEALIMERLEALAPEARPDLSGEVSLRSWIVTGLIILLSLSSAFIGMNANQIAARDWTSFLLPLGLTVGITISGYGALFIGTHVKELSERFKLH